MVASQLFARWNAITDLRIEKHKWVLASGDPALKEYFGSVSRSVSRARIRLTIENSRWQVGSNGLPQDRGGNIINGPSDDKLLPLAQEASPLPRRPLSLIGPDLEYIS